MTTRLSSLLAFLVLLIATGASAEVARQRAGIVTAIRGDVSLLHPGQEPQTPGIKADVFEGDTVTTGDRGRMQICFEDDSILSIGRGAKVEITKFLFDPSAKQGAMRIEIKEGFFRVLGGAVTRIAPENFETIAGTASIGIRGCSFGGEVLNGTATLVFFGSNIGGGIEVTGDGVRRAVGTPGDGVTVPKDGPPSMPSPMERFGVRILDETDGSGGGSNDGSGPGDGSGGLRENPVDPTKTLDQSLPDLLPEETPVIFHHGFTIGEDQETGWLYKNGSPGMLSLQLTSEGSVLDGVATGKMTVSVHSDADFNPYRDGTFLLPVLTFGITDGTFTDGTDYYTGDTAVEVTKSTISPAPEPKSYMNWGKWEMTIVDPNAIERETATHTVHGLWIATDLAQTDLDDLRSTTGDLILGGDFQGSYAGEAHCLRNGTTLLNGTSDFQVNFREQAFTGQFDFDAGPSMGFAGNVNRDGSVQGYCTGVSGEQVISTKSLIEGALYDQGTVIGTAWNALTDQNSYIGVAGGQGTITPSGTTTAVTGQ